MTNLQHCPAKPYEVLRPTEPKVFVEFKVPNPRVPGRPIKLKLSLDTFALLSEHRKLN